MRADSLLVFAGAGASRASPGRLPVFNALRDQLLREIGLDTAVPTGTPPSRWTPQQLAAAGLNPEPFFGALLKSRIDISSWLKSVLGTGTPNAVHECLAQLALGGARVWTVNFDELIERADPAVTADAWPSTPTNARLLKPHGTLNSALIVTSQDVVRPLRDDWRTRLTSDVLASDLIVFVGYSARDLDFRPLWNELTNSRPVLWFDFPSDLDERDRKQAILENCSRAGNLTLAPNQPNPTGLPNPSWDFVQWCATHGLACVDAKSRDLLLRNDPPHPFPPLDGNSRLARAAVLQLLSDYKAARTENLRGIVSGPHRGDHLKSVWDISLNHDVVLPTVAGRVLAVVPRTSLTAPTRDRAVRKWLAAASNRGHHETVLRYTNNLPADTVSTMLLLRSTAVRWTGDLDEAAELARTALERARMEGHEHRAVSAAFQHVIALMWAGRITESRLAWRSELVPLAEISANRWVAWSDFLDASLLIHERAPGALMGRLARCTTRFRTDGLFDGVVAAQQVRITALRLRGDMADYVRETSNLERMVQAGPQTGRYYTRRHSSGAEAAQLERGWYLLFHASDASAAELAFRQAAVSPYPVHQAQAHLGLASALTGTQRNEAARAALAIATDISAGLVSRAARGILAGAAPQEQFFP